MFKITEEINHCHWLSVARDFDVCSSPHYSKDKDLDRIQHRLTCMVPGLKHLPYEQRLIVTSMDLGRKTGSCGPNRSLQDGEWYVGNKL